MKQLNQILPAIVAITTFISISYYILHNLSKSNSNISWQRLMKTHLSSTYFPVNKNITYSVFQNILKDFRTFSNSPSQATTKTPQIASSKENTMQYVHQPEKAKSNSRLRLHQTDATVNLLFNSTAVATIINHKDQESFTASSSNLMVNKYNSISF